jgi:hypothetical protein
MAGNLTAMIAAIFSGSAVSTDPYFNLTTLLLSTTATNGQQNNTFQDSSTNNFTITRNPATGPNAPTQGTFSPFSQTGWSNYFDGAGDFINTPATGQFAPAGDFTIRFYFYLTSLAATNHLVGNYTSTATTDWLLQVTTTGVLEVYTNGGTLRLSQSGITANQWYYVTVTRTGTTITGQLNGTNFNTTATYTQSGTFGTSTKSIYLGMRTGSTNPLTGYLSNVSLVDGSAIQTVPTAPLTDVTGTKLLTCQSNRFVDNSSSPNTLTIGGNTTVVPFSPFNPTSAWSASTVGGSAYYDGTGDSLTIPTAQAGLGFGTGDFSTEFWAYRTNANSFILIFQLNTFNNGLYIRTESTTYNDSFYFVNQSYNWDPATNFKPNSWTHICVTRQSGTLRFFANGKLIVNATNTSNMGAATADIGASGYAGYLSGVRVVKGSVPSEYQTSITTVGTQVFNPPTAPPTNVTNTQLLLNFTNSGIYDATAKNVLETVGTAQASTTQAKFGTTSMYFDGTTTPEDLLSTPVLPYSRIGAGDYTLEMWIRPSRVNTLQALLTYGSTAFRIFLNSSNIWFLNSGTSIVQYNSVVTTANQWYYLVLVRKGSSGTNCAIFLDGTRLSTGFTNTTDFNTGTPYIGGEGASNLYQGYMQDFRLTRFARYDPANSTIIVPTAAFPVQ